jgi:molybdate transport system substrate-binding protein
MRSRSLAAVAFLLVVPGLAQAAEIKLLASGAVKEAYLELLPGFEQASGHSVKAAWSNTTDIQKRVAAGEIADLVILGDNGTAALIKDGTLVANSVAFAKSGIYIAVRAGAPAPDISSADALKRSISGEIRRLFERRERHLPCRHVPEAGPTMRSGRRPYHETQRTGRRELVRRG